MELRIGAELELMRIRELELRIGAKLELRIGKLELRIGKLELRIGAEKGSGDLELMRIENWS